jgi:2-oxoglutarate dehydrogenase complex dehydrogenase (E1) component-like enzyme
MEIADQQRRPWLQQRMEPTLNQPSLTPSLCQQVLFRLVAAEEFEHFLHTRYLGHRHFSI